MALLSQVGETDNLTHNKKPKLELVLSCSDDNKNNNNNKMESTIDCEEKRLTIK